MTPCDEPRCHTRAAFTLRGAKTSFNFCEAHVWPRVHHWLDRQPVGYKVSVERITEGEEKKAFTTSDMRRVQEAYRSG